jgi:photosystem II stability/assembly factor-like uncharacterized protein
MSSQRGARAALALTAIVAVLGLIVLLGGGRQVTSTASPDAPPVPSTTPAGRVSPSAASTLPVAAAGSASTAPVTTAVAPPASPSPSLSARATGPTVEDVGTFAPDGIWAVTADGLLVSGDGGATWSAHALPGGAAVSDHSTTLVEVLDASHVWVLTGDDFGTGVSGDVTRDRLALTLHHSTDGGRTWADIPIAGNYPGSLQALHFRDADHGDLLITPGRFDTATSTLLRTTDGGRNWRIAGHGGWLGTKIATPDASTIWAASAGDAGPVERRIFAISRDGGRTWRDVRLPGVPRVIGQWATFLQPPVLVDGLTGVALVAHNDGSGMADIDRSDDAGRTWRRVSTTTATSLAVIDQWDWLRPASTPGTIEETNDAGRTWRATTAHGLPAATITWLGGFDTTGNGALLASGANPAGSGLYVTADSGLTWQPADLTTVSVPSPGPASAFAPVATVSSVAFFDAAHGLVVGATPDGRGAVWRSADGGRTWAEARSGTGALVFVAVAGRSRAWTSPACVPETIARGCTLLASTDGGRTWSVVSDRAFNAASFVDADHGWAVAPPTPGAGTYRILATADGGRSWAALPAAPCRTIGFPVAVSFVSRLHGWIGCAGEGSAGQAPKAVAETTDGGRTWHVRARATPPRSRPGDPADVGSISMSDYLDGIAMRPSGLGLAWEGRGGTLRTTDGGRTWRTMPPGGSDAGPVPAGGWAITDRDWLILLWDPTAQATVLYATHDGGRTWQAGSHVPGVP